MTSRIKSFCKFVAEQVNDNPNPQSGGLEANKRKPKSGNIEVDPEPHASLIQLGQAIIRDRKEGSEKQRPNLVGAMKRLEGSGVDGDKLIKLRSAIEGHLNRDPKMGGLYRKLAKSYQETQPPGKNLDIEA